MSNHKNSTLSTFNISNNSQLSMLVVLRLVIGWHFLYEGVSKIVNPGWSSIGFLLDSKGPFEGMFHSMAINPDIVSTINFLNIWGLTLIGLGLITGLFTQIATIAGMVLLAFYYISHPPLISTEYILPDEGNYLYVNKNLIEFFVLWLLFIFPTSNRIGLDRFIFKKSNSNKI